MADSANIFDPRLLARLEERREPALGLGEAVAAGPWRLEPRGEHFAVLRECEPPDHKPLAVARFRELGCLIAAVYPATGRGNVYLAGEEREGSRGFPVRTHRGDMSLEPVAWLRYNEDSDFFDALKLADHFMCSPASLAFLLEAVSADALRQAGAIVARRLEAEAADGDVDPVKEPK